MRRKLKRVSLISLAVIVTVFVTVAAAFMWRLSQGPVALTFLSGRAQGFFDANLPGAATTVGDVIIERDAEGTPRFRLRDIAIADRQGNLLARAPRAAVKVNGRALLTGRIEPVELELIGPRIMVRRQLDGSLRLGFAPPAAAGEEPVDPAAGLGADGKSSRTDRVAGGDVPPWDDSSMKMLGDFYRAFLAGDGRLSSVPSLNSIRVSNAHVSVYDEGNDAFWIAPRANLVFNRVPYGVALFADASIESGNKPWRTEIVASYKVGSREFSVNARIFNLVPADLSDKMFALSQLAQVRLPLSGHAEAEFTDTGRVKKASAELAAAAGQVGFPGYISEPVVIDEGLIRLDYDPSSGELKIANSSIYIGGTQAQLEGSIQPVRTAEGKLEALKLSFTAGNVSIEGAGAAKSPLALDRVEFRGTAALGAARLEVDDLLLMSGNAGIRARGQFVGGEKAVGVYATGVVRDLHSELVKKLWPPIVASGAREWIQANILNARITEGSFRVAIPAEALAAALSDVSLPDDTVDLRFTLTDVDTRYYEHLPALRGASGTGHLTGDNFRLELRGARVELPSGKQVVMREGVMASTKLAEKLSPTTFNITAVADAKAILELIDHEPLRLVTEAGFDASKIGGDATVELRIDVPLARKVPDNSVEVAAKAMLDNAVYKDALDGMSIEDGKIHLNVTPDQIEAKGPVRLNGVPAELTWTRSFDEGARGRDRFVVEAEFDEKGRERLGAHINDYLRGPVKVKVSAEENNGRIIRAQVDADLTKAELRIDPIGWSRPPGTKTVASFDLDLSEPDAMTISDLKIAGGEVKVAGKIKIMDGGEVMDANFPTLRLGDETDLSVKLKTDEGVLVVAAKGRSFDARPLIGDLFSPAKHEEEERGRSIRLEAAIDRVYANRGEVVTGVNGTIRVAGSKVAEADLSGQFLNGASLNFRIAPQASGVRELSLTGRDGGAALRAANLYSKIAGGTIELRAKLGAGSQGSIQEGMLVIRNFEVLDETRLTGLDGRSSAARNGPRRGGQSFSKLSLPFTVDRSYVRIGDALIKGPGLGASAQGQIRKADGAMDIGGTIIPAYALNAALGEVPILGQLLVGGKGQGVFGLNYALRGTMREPKFIVNPVSAIAPGIFRRLFDMGGHGVAADGSALKPKPRQERDSIR